MRSVIVRNAPGLYNEEVKGWSDRGMKAFKELVRELGLRYGMIDTPRL